MSKTVVVNIRMDSLLYARVKRLAKHDDRSVSSYIRNIVRNAIESRPRPSAGD